MDWHEHRPGRHWQVRSNQRLRGMDDWCRWSHCGVEGSLRWGGVPTPVEVRRSTGLL